MDTIIDSLNSSLADCKSDAFKDVVRVESLDAEPIGDGTVVVISEIKRIVMTLVTSKGEKKKLKGIAKIETQGAGQKMAEEAGAFKNEFWMYGKVLKEMEKLLDEVNDKHYLWPECYLCSEKKFIFQDLCEIGYRIVPTKKLLDVEHATHAMKAIGKYHAMSVVLKERGLLHTETLGCPFFAMKTAGIETMMKMCFDSTTRTISSWGPEWAYAQSRFEKYWGNSCEKFYELWQSTRGEWDVLCHGDFSMRNMMFHYPPGTNKPDGVKFVDFQICNWSNLGFDLANLLNSSLHPKILKENMHQFLSTYADSFSDTCKALGYKGQVPTVQDVKKCFDSMHYFSFLMTITQLPFFIGSPDEDASQDTASEFISNYTETSDAPKSIDLFDNSNEVVTEILQTEFKYYMDKKLM